MIKIIMVLNRLSFKKIKVIMILNKEIKENEKEIACMSKIKVRLWHKRGALHILQTIQHSPRVSQLRIHTVKRARLCTMKI